jgi:DNA-binding NarL/FixJ family response regulator
VEKRIVIAGTASNRRLLAAAGFAVVAQPATAREAVAAVEREQPDVCLLDADLPGGALVAAAAIASPVGPPAVVVIGAGGEREARAAALAGADAYVPRYADDRLLDTIAALLRRRRNPRSKGASDA